jgi:hypothetical protein
MQNKPKSRRESCKEDISYNDGIYVVAVYKLYG